MEVVFGYLILSLLILIPVGGLILYGLIQKITYLDYLQRARKETLTLAYSKNWRNRNK